MTRTSLTAHCLVKNEENFVGFAIRSVIDYVDQMIVFDTGSTDKTVVIIEELAKQYPDKIIFEEKGPCDKIRHTQLRQEMLDRTTTDWFMILDGDEVWTERGMEEAVKMIASDQYDVLETFFYECVGDVYHTHYKAGYKTIRFARTNSCVWLGEYAVDTLVIPGTHQKVTESKSTVTLNEKFWHLTHLPRSSSHSDSYSSGGIRENKLIQTYLFVGRRISQTVPEVFQRTTAAVKPLTFIQSVKNFCLWIINKYTRNFGRKV